MLSKWLFILTLLNFLSRIITLPEYRQNDYDVTIERAEIVWYNKSFARDVKLAYVFYNRTQKVFNGSAYLITDIGTDVTGTAQFYKLSSNEYREFPMRVGVNLCEEYERNNFNAKEILKRISNVKPCPAKKGFYYVYNAMADFTRFPPYIPRGSYKAVGKAYHKEDFVGEAHGYFVVKDKPLKWK